MDMMTQTAMLFSFIGAICVVLSGMAKSNRSTHQISILDCSAHTISNILFEGYSGALTTAVALVREVLATKGKMTNTIQAILCTIIIILGFACNTNGFIGLLPIVGSVQYTIIGCRAKSSFTELKIALLISISLWTVYDITIGAYPSVVANIITAIMCIITLKNHQNKQQENSTQKEKG